MSPKFDSELRFAIIPIAVSLKSTNFTKAAGKYLIGSIQSISVRRNFLRSSRNSEITADRNLQAEMSAVRTSSAALAHRMAKTTVYYSRHRLIMQLRGRVPASIVSIGWFSTLYDE